MSDDRAEPPGWKVLRNRGRPWHRRLSAQLLAQSEATTPDGSRYLVRILRNSPVVPPAKGSSSSDPLSVATDFVIQNVRAAGKTGWSVKVVAPATSLRAERTLFVQPVSAAPIVADVALAITNALVRGERLWDKD